MENQAWGPCVWKIWHGNSKILTMLTFCEVPTPLSCTSSTSPRLTAIQCPAFTLLIQCQMSSHITSTFNIQHCNMQPPHSSPSCTWLTVLMNKHHCGSGHSRIPTANFPSIDCCWPCSPTWYVHCLPTGCHQH